MVNTSHKTHEAKPLFDAAVPGAAVVEPALPGTALLDAAVPGAAVPGAAVPIAALIDILKGRHDFYLTLAGLYVAPLSAEQIDTMAETDFTVFGAGEPLLEEGFDDIRRFLRKRHTGTRQMLATDYTMSFGGVDAIKGRTAAPYASLFLSEKGLLYQEPRNEVYQLYKSEALRLKKGIDLPEDHLSFELEFLSLLSARASDALANNKHQESIRILSLSRDFINQHIFTWFTAFENLANLIIKTRFYRGVLKITQGYLLLDLQTLNDLIDELLRTHDNDD